MRRPVKNRKEVQPDIRYGSVLISKLVNKTMQHGKKAVAAKAVYGALLEASKKLSKEPAEVLEIAIANAGPSVELKSRRVGGANYQVPIEVRPERRITLAIRWIVDAARSAKGKPIEVKLTEELINACNNAGNAVKKRNDMHRMAEANKAFAHLAWGNK